METAARLLEPILALHESIRTAVCAASEQQPAEQLAAVAGNEGDTIYAIDRVGEDVLIEGLVEVAREEPLVLIAEGIAGGEVVLPRDARGEDCRWRVIVDPIDGTRGLMYQKRSGWILTGIAPNRGSDTSLRDIVLAVQTEIPLVKQHLFDQLWAYRGEGVRARRTNRLSGESQAMAVRPSDAESIDHGFASVARFFPGARDVLAAIDDEVMEALVESAPGRAPCFEDQYTSTGGQLYELMMGHDRFIADLRPLVEPIRAERGLPPAHCCHPYDLCTALIAEEAGVILTGADGAPVDVPLDVSRDVTWIGYANAALRARVEPVLRQALRRHGLSLSS